MDEDKLPAKEQHHVWTLSDFIERRQEWDQGDETRLAEYLRQLSNKITQGANNTLNELNELVASVDDTGVKVANINNEFQLLADKQFIENKVQEEDETVQQTNIEKPVANKPNGSDILVNNLKEALKISFKAIDTHFEKVTVIVSDSDDDDDELKHEETVLRPRTFYKKLNLPLLSGDTQPEIVIESAMSSESDSDIEQPTNTFKDEVSLQGDNLSNDVPEDDSHSISQSKIIHDTGPQTISSSNAFEPEKLNTTNVPLYIDNTPDDLFSPPPLLNDNDEDDLDNEYNMFGNDSNNIYGERNLWDDNDDDDNDFLNNPSLPIYSDEPPLPVYSDEPPQQIVKPKTQEKVEVPNLQQSLNDELRKRFQKDNVSLLSDNENIESPKIKVPKGAVNILVGTDSKPSIPTPVQNIKQTTISQINTNMAGSSQNNYINEDLNNSYKVHSDSHQNQIISSHNDSIDETNNRNKTRSLFKQDSDDEDLFSEKTSSVISVSKSEIKEQKDNPMENTKLSRSIFSESDSDEDFLSSKPNIKEIDYSKADNTNTLLNSSDDDLFNEKSILKQKSFQSSFQVHNEKLEEKNNKLEHILKLPTEKKSTNEVINKDVGEELKSNLEDSSSITNTSIIEKTLLQNNDILNSNSMESSSTNYKINQNNQTPLNSQLKNKVTTLFSSDEDEFDDNTFFSVNESNKNSIKKDEFISNSTNLVKNENNEPCASKVDMFDSSSDDDIFNTKTNNILTRSKISKHSDSKEINNDIINQAQKLKNIDKIDLIDKSIVGKNTTNILNLLSDDNDNDYLSFNNVSDSSMNLSASQMEAESMSLLSEEALKSQMDSTIKDTIESLSPENIFKSKNQEPMFASKENITESNKLLFSSSNNDKQQLLSSFKEETNISDSSLNLSFKNSFDNKKQESFINNKINTSESETINVSKNNLIQHDKSSSCLNSDNDEEVLSNLKNQTENSESEEIKVISQTPDSNTNAKDFLKDLVDGSSFSSLANSRNEETKKLPGKLNKNAGAFINIKGLLPNSKSPLNKSNILQSNSPVENNDDSLPTSGVKLFSAEKERAKIPVKRRPQSRKARLAASRMSSIDIGHESNLQQSSRLFGSTSDLVDYQSSPILNDDVTDSINIIQNKIQASFNDNSLFKNNEKNSGIKEGDHKTKQNILDLFDDDSDPFESQEEVSDNNDKKHILNNKHSEFKTVNKLCSEVESVDKKYPANKSVIVKPLEIEVVEEKVTNIESVCNNQVEISSIKEVEENKSVTQNIVIPKKLNSLFDDDDDDNLFFQKSKKTKKSSSNIFDSDDELDFSQKFTKTKLAKTKSLFGDDSDDDLFSTPNKPSASNLPSGKAIDKSNQQQNRPIADGYVKLAAESVAINPLESKND